MHCMCAWEPKGVFGGIPGPGCMGGAVWVGTLARAGMVGPRAGVNRCKALPGADSMGTLQIPEPQGSALLNDLQDRARESKSHIGNPIDNRTDEGNAVGWGATGDGVANLLVHVFLE